MFCSKCGTEFPKGANFCSSCGTPASQSRRPHIIWAWVVGVVVVLVVGFAVVKMRGGKGIAKPTDVSQTASSLIDPLTNEPTGLDSSFKNILDFRVGDLSDNKPGNKVDGVVAAEIKRYFKNKYNNHDPLEMTFGPSGAFFEPNSNQELFLVVRKDKAHDYHAAGYGSYYILANDHGNWLDFATSPIFKLQTSEDIIVNGVQYLLAFSEWSGQGDTDDHVGVLSLKNKTLKIINDDIADAEEHEGMFEFEPQFRRADTAYVKKIGDNLEFKNITWIKRPDWKSYRLYNEANFNIEQEDLRDKMDATSKASEPPAAPPPQPPAQDQPKPFKIVDFIDNTSSFKGHQITIELTYMGDDSIRDSVDNNIKFGIHDNVHFGTDVYVFIPRGIQNLPNIQKLDTVRVTFNCESGSLTKGNTAIMVARP